MHAVESGVWGGRVEVGEGEGVIMHSQSSMAHYPAAQFQPPSHEVDYAHPRSVLRGFAEIDHVDQGACLLPWLTLYMGPISMSRGAVKD